MAKNNKEKVEEIEEIEKTAEEVEEPKVEKKEKKEKKEDKKTKKPKSKDVADDLDAILYGEGKPEDIDLGEVPEFITGKVSGKGKKEKDDVPAFLKY
jgi:hypothetical protein